MAISVICTQEISDVTLVQRKKNNQQLHCFLQKLFFLLRKFMRFVVVKQRNILMNLLS